MEKHFRSDRRDRVRIKSLDVLLDMFKSNRHMYEEELVEKVVAPFLKGIDADPSLEVRLQGIKVSIACVENKHIFTIYSRTQVLTSVCSTCNSREVLTLLDIMEKIVTRPAEDPIRPSSRGHVDVMAAVTGLVSVKK